MYSCTFWQALCLVRYEWRQWSIRNIYPSRKHKRSLVEQRDLKDICMKRQTLLFWWEVFWIDWSITDTIHRWTDRYISQEKHIQSHSIKKGNRLSHHKCCTHTLITSTWNWWCQGKYVCHIIPQHHQPHMEVIDVRVKHVMIRVSYPSWKSVTIKIDTTINYLPVLYQLVAG